MKELLKIFKKRLIEFLLYLIGIPLFFAIWIYICGLALEYTPLDKWMNAASQHSNFILGVFLAIILLMLLYTFINWLFIEPYKNYRKTKKAKGAVEQ